MAIGQMLNMAKYDRWQNVANMTNGKTWQIWQMTKYGKYDKWQNMGNVHLRFWVDVATAGNDNATIHHMMASAVNNYENTKYTNKYTNNHKYELNCNI